MGKRVFVVHGRDVQAKGELVKFLHAVGLDELSFEAVARELGPAPFIAEIVLRGIAQANAAIVLFTPDEQAALFDPATGRHAGTGANANRWQARPNVIFEAGVAFGTSRERLILAVLGADVELFSDVHGVHFVRLDGAGAKRALFERLSQLLGPLEVRRADWETSTESGDFQACVRRRWEFFDEIEELWRNLANRRLGKTQSSLLELVREVALADDRDWTTLRPRDFIQALPARFQDDAYWWLLVLGFFRFDNIEYFGITDDSDWDESVDEAVLAPRGVALIERLRAVNS